MLNRGYDKRDLDFYNVTVYRLGHTHALQFAT